jgi:hypothetical protein
MTYRTDGQETAILTANLNAPTIPAIASADASNTGFCLDYQEK